MIDPGGERRLGGEVEAEKPGLLAGTHPPEELRGVAVRAAFRGIGRLIDRLLPEWREDVAGRDRIHANVMRRFVDRERFGERGDGSLRRDVGGRTRLPHRGDKAGHVDDVALHPAEVGQRELAGGEIADEIQIEERPEVVDREVVDGLMRGVPAGVVDQAVDPSEALDRPIDHALNVVGFRHVRADEHRASGAARIELGLEGAAFGLVARTEDDMRAPLFDEHLHAAGANPLGAAGHDRDLVLVARVRGQISIFHSPPAALRKCDYRNVGRTDEKWKIEI